MKKKMIFNFTQYKYILIIYFIFNDSKFDQQSHKSTKNASKERRDKINEEMKNLKDLLPLPQQTRQRLSQLQMMGLICVYVRKTTYFNKCKYQDAIKS